MKTARVGLLLFSVMAAATIALPQSVSFVGISKNVEYVQTSSSAPTIAASNPYGFESFIDGTSLSAIFPLTANSVTIAGGSITSFNLTYQSGDNAWGYKPPTGYADTTALNGALASGTYAFTLNNGGSSFSLGLTGDAYVVAPVASASLGTWSGNKLILTASEAASALTISSGTFAGFNSGIDRVGINLYGTNNSFNAPEAQTFVASSLNLNLAANDLVAGGTYQVQVQFNNIVDYLQNGNNVGANYSTALDSLGTNVKAFAMYTTVTSFEIQVIPEPSTYAAIFGGLACLGVAFKRRRALAGRDDPQLPADGLKYSSMVFRSRAKARLFCLGWDSPWVNHLLCRAAACRQAVAARWSGGERRPYIPQGKSRTITPLRRSSRPR